MAEGGNREERRAAERAKRKKGAARFVTQAERDYQAKRNPPPAAKEFVSDSPVPVGPLGETKNVSPRSGMGHGKGRYLIPIGIGGAAAAGYLVHRNRRKASVEKGVGDVARRGYKAAGKLVAEASTTRRIQPGVIDVAPGWRQARRAGIRTQDQFLGRTNKLGAAIAGRMERGKVTKHFQLDPFSKAQDDDKWARRGVSGVGDSWAYSQGNKRGSERSVRKNYDMAAMPTNVRSVAPIFNRSGQCSPGLKLLKVNGTGPRRRGTEPVHVHNDHATQRGKGHGSRISKSDSDYWYDADKANSAR